VNRRFLRQAVEQTVEQTVPGLSNPYVGFTSFPGRITSRYTDEK